MISPTAVSGVPAARRTASIKTSVSAGGAGHDELIVFAPAQGGEEGVEAQIGGDGAGGGIHGDTDGEDPRSSAARLAEMLQIGGEAVAHVNRRGGEARRGDGQALGDAGRGDEVRARRRVRWAAGQTRVEGQQAGARRAERAGHEDGVAGAGAGAPEQGRLVGLAVEGDVDDGLMGRAGEVAANDRRSVLGEALPQALVEALDPLDFRRGGQGE